MSDYSIWVDASADIDRECLNGASLGVLPMEYTLDGARKAAAGDEAPEAFRAFYDAQRNGAVTHTSQISPGLYREYFGPVMEKESVLYLSLSSGLTKTVDSACMAAMKLQRDHGTKIEVVDSLSATGGIGLLAEKAVENRESGMTLEQNAASLREWAGKVCHCFMAEDLMFLKRGGRISAATAVMGTMMGIKPILVIDASGRLTAVERKRGHKAAVRDILRLYQTARDPELQKRAFIVHGDAPELAENLREHLAQTVPGIRISVRPLCPIIGAHTGPGMVGLVFFGDREKLRPGE